MYMVFIEKHKAILFVRASPFRMILDGPEPEKQKENETVKCEHMNVRIELGAINSLQKLRSCPVRPLA